MELRVRSVILLKEEEEEEVRMEKSFLHKTLLGKVNLLYTMLRNILFLAISTEYWKGVSSFTLIGTLRYPGRGGKENGESLERGRRHLLGKNKLRLSGLSRVLA